MRKRFDQLSDKLLIALCILLSQTCSAASSFAVTSDHDEKLSLAAEVGRQIFFDQTLSASGKMSCASCHDPARAFGPPNNLPVQLGGAKLQSSGTRAPPSLRYKEYTPAYADRFENPDGVSAPGPGGGFDLDGRVNTIAEQAAGPFLSPLEMANASRADVAAKIRHSSYAALFQHAFGSDAFSDTAKAFKYASAALQSFQLEDESFHPYSSKYDLHAGNKIGGVFTPAETRGMKVFNDPRLGNCAACHYPGPGYNGSAALFTDFSYAAIGVPRNTALPVNKSAHYYDMGICGPDRTDHLPKHPGVPDSYCGLFKTPTLRNVATRGAFFHNGVMHTLEQVVRFYNTRDTRLEIWYPTTGGTPKKTPDANFPTYGLITTQYTGGKVQKYNDLPASYTANLDKQMPMDGRTAGSAPPMTEQNISDLICFLNTLTDEDQAGSTASGRCMH